MILINLEYFRGINYSDEKLFFEKVRIDEWHSSTEILIIDVFEGSLLWPIDNETFDKTKIFYKIVEKYKNKKIFYLCSDLNIVKRIEEWKKNVTFETLNIETICFPLSILINYNLLTEDKINKLNNLDKIKNFIALTSGPKDFRLLTLDQFYKHQYFEYSYVPDFHWDSKAFVTEQGIKEWTVYLKNNFHFKYNKRKLTEIKESSKKIGKDVFNYFLPYENFQTCCDVVLESYFVGPTFITEKTYKEFIFKRPFLLLGSAGINQSLKDLGFELYDEIFDYSFDSENDNFTRLKKFWNQIYRYIDLRPTIFRKILNVLDDKIEYNRKKYIEWYINYALNMPKSVEKILFSQNKKHPIIDYVADETIFEIKKYCEIFK